MLRFNEGLDFPDHPVDGRVVVDGLAGYLIGLFLSATSYRVGQQAALYMSKLWGQHIPASSSCAARMAARCHVRGSLLRVVTALVLLGVLAGEAAALGSIDDPRDLRTGLLLSLFFAPFGVLARWKLSSLNTRFPAFPVGTFAANMIACVVDAVADVINIFAGGGGGGGGGNGSTYQHLCWKRRWEGR